MSSQESLQRSTVEPCSVIGRSTYGELFNKTTPLFLDRNVLMVSQQLMEFLANLLICLLIVGIPSDDVWSLRESIETLFGVPSHQQRFVFAGK